MTKAKRFLPSISEDLPHSILSQISPKLCTIIVGCSLGMATEIARPSVCPPQYLLCATTPELPPLRAWRGACVVDIKTLLLLLLLHLLLPPSSIHAQSRLTPISFTLLKQSYFYLLHANRRFWNAIYLAVCDFVKELCSGSVDSGD